jgi:protein-disulfide isomerase
MAFPQILENHVETGEVQYFMKSFMIGHPWAMKAHVASECALNQDAEAYWTFKHGFFSHQSQLNSVWKQNQSRFDDSMHRWAEQAELNTERFNQCYDNMEERSEVMSDHREGRNSGVRGTPNVFVDSARMKGAVPYSQFKSEIESQQG